MHENERLSMEGKVCASESEKVRSRFDSVSYAMLAEIDYQHRERGEDFKNMMAAFMERQATFYENLSKKLFSLASLYKNA